jgi:3-hydroxybutyryl-CoA dehydrogenase
MTETTGVGVVGAGVIGTGVAQSLSQAGHRVVLVDVSESALAHAAEEIRKGVAMAALLTRERYDAAEVLARIERTTDYAALSSVSFVIENTTESEEVKAAVYGRLEAACRADAIFAANTSAVPIARLASYTSRPERVLGMHFMNPVPLKSTVEVIRGPATAVETIDTALSLLASMKKEGIVVNDGPGFVSNRVLMLTVNEAAAVVQDGVAPAADVDRIFKTCFGHKMGPLETADLIGLDTIANTLVVLRDELDDAKFEPTALLKEKVAAGELGRKSGRGFYDYGE